MDFGLNAGGFHQIKLPKDVKIRRKGERERESVPCVLNGCSCVACRKTGNIPFSCERSEYVLGI